MDLYYIYKITNNINGKTYIGQKKYAKDYPNDYEALLADGYWGSGRILKQAIKKEGSKNFTKEILVSHLDGKEAADEAEKFYIKCYRDLCKAEYNIADGGGGSAGFHHSEEMKKLLSQFNKGRKGIVPSEEGKKRISEANRGRAAWNKGVPNSCGVPWNKGLRGVYKTKKARPVLQFDLDGNLIKEWETIDAAQKEYSRNVWACLTGKRKTCRGFIWKYKEQE